MGAGGSPASLPALFVTQAYQYWVSSKLTGLCSEVQLELASSSSWVSSVSVKIFWYTRTPKYAPLSKQYVDLMTPEPPVVVCACVHLESI